MLLESIVSMKRIEKFLKTDDIDKSILQYNSNFFEIDQENAITMKNGNFYWVDNDESEDLKKNSTQDIQDPKKNASLQTIKGSTVDRFQKYESNNEETKDDISNLNDTTENLILKNINLEIKKNSFVAIIGE